MTDEEIRTSYRQAKYPKQQIKILSELTLKTRQEICDILGIDSKGAAKKRPLRDYNPVGKQVRPRMTGDEIEAIERMYAQGMCAYQIGISLGRSYKTVTSYIDRKKRKERMMDERGK